MLLIERRVEDRVEKERESVRESIGVGGKVEDAVERKIASASLRLVRA